MQGSAPLAHLARCAVDDFEGHARELTLLLSAWQSGGARERQQLGDPGTIVLESSLVASLTARLRNAPWMQQLTAAQTGDGPPLASVHRAVGLLADIFQLVHHDVPASPDSAQPGSHALKTLLQQVCV